MFRVVARAVQFVPSMIADPRGLLDFAEAVVRRRGDFGVMCVSRFQNLVGFSDLLFQDLSLFRQRREGIVLLSPGDALDVRIDVGFEIINGLAVGGEKFVDLCRVRFLPVGDLSNKAPVVGHAGIVAMFLLAADAVEEGREVHAGSLVGEMLFPVPATEIVNVEMQELARQRLLQNGTDRQVGQSSRFVTEHTLVCQRRRESADWSSAQRSSEDSLTCLLCPPGKMQERPDEREFVPSPGNVQRGFVGPDIFCDVLPVLMQMLRLRIFPRRDELVS
ncbi:MAG: hypothetical protein KDA89_08790 [Planctomycetaceae bacterium]|nr:hypothetical protein [Planctomycetaceae bacterium]